MKISLFLMSDNYHNFIINRNISLKNENDRHDTSFHPVSYFLNQEENTEEKRVN